MATNSEYWKKREQENLWKNLKSEAEYAKEIQQTYKFAMDQIQKEIDSFYAKYADKEGITIAQAKKRASKLDMEEYSRKAKKYVKEKNFSKQANEEMKLYNLTMKVNRLELLKASIGLELVSAFDEMQQFYEQILTDRTLDEFERQAGILGSSVPDNAAVMAATIVNASFHNAKYSERIWMHQDLLRNELGKLLTRGMVQGKNPRALARELRKTFQASIFNSLRLLWTELARVQTAAQMQSYKDNGFAEYEYLTARDFKVCATCKALDGKIFKVDEEETGTNSPPMHPCCRCSTTAHMDLNAYEKWLDGYSEHGMSFKEWQERSGKATFMKKDGMSKAQLKSAAQIESMAKEMDVLVGKHTKRPSKWSGNIDFLDGSEGYCAAKEWSCNISARLDITKHQLIHEHLHARSVSHYDVQTYRINKSMEELSVEIFAREISKKSDIDIVYSDAYEGVKYLYRINKLAKIAKTDYEFAKQLFEVPVTKRADWLDEQITNNIENIGDFERAMKALRKVK